MKIHVEMTNKEAAAFEKQELFSYFAKSESVNFSEYLSETVYVAEVEIEEKYFTSLVKQAKMLVIPFIGILNSAKEFITEFIDELRENVSIEKNGEPVKKYQRYEMAKGQYKVSVMCPVSEKYRELDKIEKVLDQMVE